MLEFGTKAKGCIINVDEQNKPTSPWILGDALLHSPYRVAQKNNDVQPWGQIFTCVCVCVCVCSY